MPARRSSGAADSVRWAGAGAGGRRVVRFAGGNSSGPGGGGGVHGPGPLAPAHEHARCRACPAAGGWASPTRRPPGPLEFPPTPKGQRKSQAPRSMGPGCLNDPRKGHGNGFTPWAKPGPTLYGPGRLHPPCRGLPPQAAHSRCRATIAVRVAPRRTPGGIISVCGGRGRYWF